MICVKHNICKVCTILAVFAIFFTSCSKSLGYSVMLWSSNEYGLHDGDLVQVYIKSNISQVYVVGTPNTQQKIEVPFWQIMEPQSKNKILAAYERYRDYQNMYATVAVDGLPVRFEPVNTSRQVYRLRKNETVKVLYKGKGVAPMSGSSPLPGDWLYILTKDGTMGWCFSYNLRLYDELTPLVAEEAVEELDENLEKVLDSDWYPESYQNMVNNRRVDIKQLMAGYHFSTGKESGKIELRLEGVAANWEYKGTEKIENNVYRFTGTPLTINIKNANYISLQYADDRGMPKAYPMVTMQTSVEEIIAEEIQRREVQYKRILDHGTMFSSSNYGDLLFMEDGTFSWNDYQRLGSIVPAGAGNHGKVEFDVFLDSKLMNDNSSLQQSGYDGAITFKFDRSSKPVYFLYRLEASGIRFEEVQPRSIKNGLISERSSNALVLFFSKN
ncbi:MAG: SH3 domain-containing protein [Treponemataceae bacterium]|nr:SH3 domain-containing protein [Treponemataceae bacterium]